MDIQRIFDELLKVRSGKGASLTIQDLSFLLDFLLNSAPSTNSKYKELIDELSKLSIEFHNIITAHSKFAGRIMEFREVADSNAKDMQDINTVLSGAAHEILDLVQEYTEKDTHSEASTRKLVESLTEKCSFHDLVGQRLTRVTGNANKILAALNEYDADIKSKVNVRSSYAKQSSNENLMHGPAKLGKGLSQGAVDQMLSEKGGK